jgi:hypothetical protein
MAPDHGALSYLRQTCSLSNKEDLNLLGSLTLVAEREYYIFLPVNLIDTGPNIRKYLKNFEQRSRLKMR